MIDFHTHIFPEKIAAKTIAFLSSVCKTEAYTNGMEDGLLNSAEEAGLSLSVILPVVTKPSQFRSVNEYAQTFRGGKNGLLSFGGIHPDSPGYKSEIREIRQMGLKGIKLHPDYQDVYFHDIRYKRILACAEEEGLITVVHAGKDPKCMDNVHCTPEMAAEVLDDVRPERLVLAHLGGNGMWDDVEHYLVGRNVYFDTAVVLGKVPDAQLLRIIRTHGAEKILFATDSPWAGQREFAAYLNGLPLSEREKQLIFHENASKLLDFFKKTVDG